MRLKLISSVALTIAAFLLPCAQGHADDNTQQFFASFSGFQEVGALNNETGAIFSQGQGQLLLNVDTGNRLINFQLTFSGLSAPVTVSHIHFGQRHVPGGVMVFFCSNLPNPPPGTQACPSGGGTVTGTITGANVVGPTAQNVSAGDFDAVVAALNANTAYGNIHTTKFPAGEIRGQILQNDNQNQQ
jgi:hypothetical protein